jgi:hypothetical protein
MSIIVEDTLNSSIANVDNEVTIKVSNPEILTKNLLKLRVDEFVFGEEVTPKGIKVGDFLLRFYNGILLNSSEDLELIDSTDVATLVYQESSV